MFDGLDEQHGVKLRLSAQRALWGHVPASLRAVSLEMRGNVIAFRAVFEPGASDADRELLSIAAAEVIADFAAPTTIDEEYIELALSDRPSHLRYLVFLRAEPSREGEAG